MEWLGQLLATFVGGGMAILGGYLSYRLQEKQRTKALYREKGEELYSLVQKWMSTHVRQYLFLVKVMSEDINYNQYLDSVKSQEGDYDWSRIKLTIEVYFPHAKGAHDAVIKCSDKLSEIRDAHKRAYKRQEDGLAFGKPFIEAQKEFNIAAEHLKQEIIKCVRAL